MTINEIKLHGVFLEIFSMGVFITGDAGVGKSESALNLIDRKHFLIADDCVTFSLQNGKGIGTCPALTQNLLEIRGLGILDIELMYGPSSIKPQAELGLIINLYAPTATQWSEMKRLSGDYCEREILGVKFPQLNLAVNAGRNLAILIEGAVRNHKLKLDGIDVGKKLVERHKQSLQEQNSHKST